MKKKIQKNLSNKYFHRIEMMEKHVVANVYNVSTPISFSFRIKLKKYIHKISFRLKLFLVLCLYFFSKPLLHVVRQTILIKERVGPKKHKMVKKVIVKCEFVVHVIKQKIEDYLMLLFLTSHRRGVARLAKMRNASYGCDYIEGRFAMRLKFFAGLGRLLAKLNKKKRKKNRKNRNAFRGLSLLHIKVVATKYHIASSNGLLSYLPASWYKSSSFLLKKKKQKKLFKKKNAPSENLELEIQTDNV